MNISHDASPKVSWRFFCALVLLASLTAGCGYHVGSLADSKYRTVAVPMFQNKTFAPQLQAQLTGAVIRCLQADGSLRVTTEADADLVVEGTLVEVRREPLRFLKANEGVPREYRLTLVASVTLRDKKTGKLAFEAMRVTGETDYFIGADLQASEMQAAPSAAEDLARRLVPRIVEGW